MPLDAAELPALSHLVRPHKRRNENEFEQESIDLSNTMTRLACLTATFLSTAALSMPAFGAVSVTAFAPPELESSIQFEGEGAITISPLSIDKSPIGKSQVNVGANIRSYLVKFTNTSAMSIDDFSAVLQVSGKILGIQTELSSLRGTRFALDAEPAFDGAAPAGAIESNDKVTISGNEVSIYGKVGNRGVDPIRIFTAVPEAVSFAVWSGLAGIGLVAGQRRRKA